jgi:predicted enzyme related to lactoylglutathione lyase
MKRVTLVKLLADDMDQALEFYTTRLGFEVAEDERMGDYRWLLVRLPDNREFCLNLDAAKTAEQKTLIGRQAADLPLFSIDTDDCRREYEAMKARGVAFEGEPETHPYGTGVLLRDLYGNRIYLNQD